MKKLNVQIKRIEEDVVATSPCQHPGAIHVQLTNVYDNRSDYIFAFNSYNSATPIKTDESDPFECFYSAAFDDYQNAKVGDWYYLDENAQDITELFKKCNGDHSNLQ